MLENSWFIAYEVCYWSCQNILSKRKIYQTSEENDGWRNRLIPKFLIQTVTFLPFGHKKIMTYRIEVIIYRWIILVVFILVNSSCGYTTIFLFRHILVFQADIFLPLWAYKKQSSKINLTLSSRHSIQGEVQRMLNATRIIVYHILLSVCLVEYYIFLSLTNLFPPVCSII